MEPASLSNIENGRYYPTADNLQKIIEVLQVKPSDLYTFEHLAPNEQLIAEMNEIMAHNEKVPKLMYKFFQTIKSPPSLSLTFL